MYSPQEFKNEPIGTSLFDWVKHLLELSRTMEECCFVALLLLVGEEVGPLGVPQLCPSRTQAASRHARLAVRGDGKKGGVVEDGGGGGEGLDAPLH